MKLTFNVFCLFITLTLTDFHPSTIPVNDESSFQPMIMDTVPRNLMSDSLRKVSPLSSDLDINTITATGKGFDVS